MNDEAMVVVRRTTSYADRLRAYRIEIDGVVIGSVRAGQSLALPVKSGRHSIALRIDWCGSGNVEFEVRKDEQAVFDCGSNLAGWRMLLALVYVIFRTRDYLWLRRAS
jgi:hypothetical protein